ncbi:hypothetical protein AA0Y32_07895 [Georgenia phoenicis]
MSSTEVATICTLGQLRIAMNSIRLGSKIHTGHARRANSMTAPRIATVFPVPVLPTIIKCGPEPLSAQLTGWLSSSTATGMRWRFSAVSGSAG